MATQMGLYMSSVVGMNCVCVVKRCIFGGCLPYNLLHFKIPTFRPSLETKSYCDMELDMHLPTQRVHGMPG